MSAFTITSVNTPSVVEIRPDGEVWVRGDTGLVFTGLKVPPPPTLVSGSSFEYAFEIMRELGLALHDANRTLGKLP